MRCARAGVSVGDEALIVDRSAGIERFLVGDDFAGVAGRSQILPDEFNRPDQVGPRQFGHAINRFRQGNVGQRGGDII